MVDLEDPGAVEPGAVRIEIPAEHRFVALTRVAAASLAADIDAAIDDVEDLRVAVNELVGVLVEATSDRVRVRMWSQDRVMHVVGSCTADATELQLDELTRRILDATVDGYAVGDGSFRMHKHLHEV